MTRRTILWLLTLALLGAPLLFGASCSSDSPSGPDDNSPSTPLEFLSAVSVTPQGVFVDVATDVILATTLGADSGWTVDELRLYLVNAAGDSIEQIGLLADNGDLVNHDEIQGDGVFTGVLPDYEVDSPQTLRLRLLALASKGGSTATLWSDVVEFTVDEPTTPAEFAAVDSQIDAAESEYEDLVGGGATDAEAKAGVATYWAAQPDVAESYVGPDGNVVWAVYDDGLTVGLYLPSYTDGEVFGAAPRRGRATPPANSSVGVAPLPRLAPLAPRDDDDPNQVHSNQALVLSPFHSWIETLAGGTTQDPSDEVYDLFVNSECPSFGVMYLADSGAGAAAFANLDDYGAISIVTHGTLLAEGQVCLMTGEVASLANTLYWFWDLYGANPTMTLLSHGGVKYLSVKASFISKYNHSFPNSMIYVCACQGMKNATLHTALRGAGAGYVAGYDETVGVAYANGVTFAFWENVLVDGDTAGEAHDNVAPLTDPGHLHANFVDFGNMALVFGSDLNNGDFEQGSLAGWSVVGDGRVITQLGSAGPTGDYMGIISTGLGFTVNSGAIYQELCLPLNASTLELDWNFFSEEFLEWCGSEYQDYFQVSVFPEGSLEAALFYRQIDDLCGAVAPAGIIFDQGPYGDDAGVYTTDWEHLSVSVSAYAGQSVILRLEAGDVGDSIYDSAILLDNIRITTTAAP
jgi:hypothetical protein